MRRRGLSLRAAVVALSTLSCQAPAGSPACVPGRTVGCACPGNTTVGLQTCRADGAGFDTCSCAPPPPASGFHDVTAAAGVAYHQGPPLDGTAGCLVPSFCELDLITGAAAVGDYDGDGWPDLYVTVLAGTPILFKNRGDGTFADVTAAAGLQRFGNYNGAAWLDVDNDGDVDLFVQGIGDTRHFLWINDGHGHFSEQAAARGVALDDGLRKMATSVAVGDYDRDGWLDVHVAEWGFKEFIDIKQPGHTRLFHNLGPKAPGHFEDVTVAAGAQLDEKLQNGAYSNVFSFAGAFVDFDGDDWPELAVTGDFGTSRLLWNAHGTFKDATNDAHVGRDRFGMGSTTGDLDGDGLIDWYVTSIAQAPGCLLGICQTGEIGNHLYRNLGDHTFDDALSKPLGIADGFWGWGAAMLDLDDDGDRDLVEVNGIDYPFIPDKQSAFIHSPMRCWENRGPWQGAATAPGAMVEVAAQLGLTDAKNGKGVVTFDYDRDGDLDLFVVNNADLPVLYRNDQARGDWLRVRVLTASGREAIGARVTVRTTAAAKPALAVIGSGEHFLAQSEATAHFGLGPPGPPVHEVRVHWADTGKERVFGDVARNQVLEVKP